jgi:pRiA4b ORF-3-like protein
MNYEYDFGDGWVHKIVLEKVLANDEGRDTLSCIAGERACPPEDCGGVWRYAELLNAISDASHAEHAEMLEWIGDDFDPERFDLAEVNKVLTAMKRRGLTTRSRAARRKRPAS